MPDSAANGTSETVWARYALAAAFALAGIVISRLLSVGAEGDYALALLVVALAAWRCGRGPGLAAFVAVAFGGMVAITPSQPLPLVAALLISASLAVVVVLISSLVSVHRDESFHLAQLAFYDPLTSLPNRALFMDRLSQANARSLRHGRMIALLFLDFDDFKLVNDRFGHAAGDALLAAVGDRLRNLVRGSDTVARLGGDEFAVLLEDVDDAGSACIVAQRLIDVLNYPVAYNGAQLRCSTSVGIAYASAGLPAPEELLRLADGALYKAKRDNKGWFSEASPSEVPTAQVRRPAYP